MKETFQKPKILTILKGRLKFGWTLLNQSTVYRNELGLTPLKQLFMH